MAMASSERDGMEARIARLESDVAHIRNDVADLKLDLRSLRDKLDAWTFKTAEQLQGLNEKIVTATAAIEVKLEAKIGDRIDGLEAKLSTKIDAAIAGVHAKIDSLDTKLDAKIDAELAAAKVWALVLYIALAGGLFGTLARGFGWL